MTRYYAAKPFAPAKNCKKIARSYRPFGVELETARCDGYNDLDGKYHFGAKTDCSISGLEFDSAPLSGDSGLAAIMDFCGAANAREWRVDHNCGFHAHFDIADLLPNQLVTLVHAMDIFYPAFSRLVASERNENCHCKSHIREDGSNRWNLAELEQAVESSGYNGFYNWMGCMDRYLWVNWTAYSKFKTCEVRSHEGTIDGQTVCDWVRLFTNFIDWTFRAGPEIVKWWRGQPVYKMRAKLDKILHDDALSARLWKQHDARVQLAKLVQS